VFNSLYGQVSGHQFPLVYFQTGSVEWELEVSAGTFQSVMNAPPDTEHRLYTYLHTRQDILRLYGFWTEQERRVFLELNTVSGIGPRQALKILSGTTAESLVRYLEEEDIPSLTRIPGLGKKTAQRLILQLKGTLVLESDSGTSGTPAPGTAGTSPSNELLEALTEMGFDRKKAAAALKRAETDLAAEAAAEAALAAEASDSPQAPAAPAEQEIFRRAIVALSSGGGR
jgi:Holliday junction DNA helicase RuvA